MGISEKIFHKNRQRTKEGNDNIGLCFVIERVQKIQYVSPFLPSTKLILHEINATKQENILNEDFILIPDVIGIQITNENSLKQQTKEEIKAAAQSFH